MLTVEDGATLVLKLKDGTAVNSDPRPCRVVRIKKNDRETQQGARTTAEADAEITILPGLDVKAYHRAFVTSSDGVTDEYQVTKPPIRTTPLITLTFEAVRVF